MTSPEKNICTCTHKRIKHEKGERLASKIGKCTEENCNCQRYVPMKSQLSYTGLKYILISTITIGIFVGAAIAGDVMYNITLDEQIENGIFITELRLEILNLNNQTRTTNEILDILKENDERPASPVIIHVLYFYAGVGGFVAFIATLYQRERKEEIKE